MDWTLQNIALKEIFDVITLGEMLALLTVYFGPRRRSFAIELGAVLALGAGLCLLLNALSRFDIHELIVGLMLMTTLYSALSLRGDLLYKSVVCLYFCTTYFQLHSAELALWDLVLPTVAFSRIGLAQLGMILLLPVNRRLGSGYSEDTPRVYVFTLLLSSALCMGLCMIALPQLVPFTAYGGLALAVSLGTLGQNMTAFYQGQQLMRAAREQIALRAVADRIHADSHLMRETEQLMGEIRTQRHERANQALVIRALCDAGDLPGLRAYVSQLFPQEEPEESVDCGHVVVSAVLSQKRAQAARAGVPLTIDAHLPPRLPIRDSDLCSLIANLLENALEGSRDVESPAVSVRIGCAKNYLCVRVTNRVSHDVLAENPRLSTTKAHAEDHGVGVPVVRSIVARYDGMLDFSVEDGCFIADALLKLSMGEGMEG